MEENRRHKGERKGSTLVFPVGMYLYVDTRIGGTGHYVTWSTMTARHDTTRHDPTADNADFSGPRFDQILFYVSNSII